MRGLIRFRGKDESMHNVLVNEFFCSERKEKVSRNEKLSYLRSKLDFIIQFM